ncbi:MAG: hypothetical protein M3R04_00565 [bacterium]|nr:hypothetical protein [bacterium]
MTPRNSAAILTCLWLACGCVERVDAPLPINAKLAAQARSWTEVEGFGGHARPLVETDDPWDKRFDAGTFERISGLDSSDDEVWVTDAGISRLQVFDYEGNWKREYGRGIPTYGTLISDAELYFGTEGGNRDFRFWENTIEGERWIGQERELFSATDVLVLPNGYMLADLARTGLYADSAARNPGLLNVPFDESLPITRLEGLDAGWPSYIAGDGKGKYFAATNPLLNVAYLFAPGKTEGPSFHLIGNRPTWSDVLSAMYNNGGSPLYLQLLERAGRAGGEPGKFNNTGGVAVAFDKAVVCDAGNKRLQIFELRTDEAFFWGQLLRVVEATKTNGQQRFVQPRDIDIAPDGHVYVLDEVRQELVELSPTFDRLGVVGSGYGDAYAVDISPNGEHIFVTDRSDDRVHHYVRGS